MRSFLALLIFLLCVPFAGAAQDDSSRAADVLSSDTTGFALKQRLTAPVTPVSEKKKLKKGVDVFTKSPTGAMLRSIIVPGWGQFYTGHYFKAVVYFGVDVGFIYGIQTQHKRYLDYESKLDNLIDRSSEAIEQGQEVNIDPRRAELERLTDFYLNDRNRLIWWTAGLTLVAAMDAYVEAHLYDFEISPNLGITPEADGLSAGLTITFPH